MGEKTERPPTLFKSLHLTPELLWGVLSGEPWVSFPTHHPLVSAFCWGWGEEKLTKEGLGGRDRKKEDRPISVSLALCFSCL